MPNVHNIVPTTCPTPDGAQPFREEDALNRVYAFWVALEYTGHCKMGWFTQVGDTDEYTGGPLDFLKELENRRREVPILWQRRIACASAFAESRAVILVRPILLCPAHIGDLCTVSR